MSEVRGKVDHLMETNTNTENHTESTSGSQPARYAELQALVASMAADFQKFYQDGNKAAGTRVRNAMQNLKTLAQTIRTEVQAIKNGGQAGGAADSDGDDSEAS